MENFTVQSYSLPKYVVIPLQTPIYGSNYAIRDKWIDLAIKSHKFLLIRTPFGQEIIDPAVYKKESRKISKVFKIPDHPMILYQRDLRLLPLQEIEKYEMEW